MPTKERQRKGGLRTDGGGRRGRNSLEIDTVTRPSEDTYFTRAKELVFPFSFNPACEARLRRIFADAVERMRQEKRIDQPGQLDDFQALAVADKNLEVLARNLKELGQQAGDEFVITEEMLVAVIEARVHLWPFWL